MEEALQAAVAKMGSTPALPAAASAPALDPMALLMAVLPKLLERGPEQDDVGEQFAALQKEEIQPLREQLANQQQLLERIFGAQKALLRKLSAIETVQSALGGAVTSLTEQMARIELINDDDGEPHGFSPTNGHNRSRMNFAELGMDFPAARDDLRRRSRRG